MPCYGPYNQKTTITFYSCSLILAAERERLQARGKAGAGWSADHPEFSNRGSDHPEFLPCFDFFYEVIFPVNKQGSIESPHLLLVGPIIPVRYGTVNK